MLYLIAWLTDFAAIMFLFVSTRYLAEQEAGVFTLGLVGACYALASGLTNMVSGSLADRIGRRPVSLTGTLVFLAGMQLVLWANASQLVFILGYVLVGVALGMIYPPVMAWLGQNKTGSAASSTYLRFCLAFNLGIACGQLGGGWIYENYGPTVPIQVAMGLVALSTVCFLVLRDPVGTADLRVESAECPHEDAIRAQAFSRLCWFANFSGMFSMSILWFLLPDLFVQLGIPADTHGVLLALGRGMTIATFLFMHFLPAWRYRFRFTVAAHLAGIAGLCGIFFGEQQFVLGLSVVGLSIMMGYNYFSSLFYSSTGNRNERKGRAFGWNEAFLGFGAVGGCFLGGWLGSANLRAPYLLAASMVTASLIIQAIVFLRSVRPLQQGT